jgi:hypothetical protein
VAVGWDVTGAVHVFAFESVMGHVILSV